MRAVDCTDHRQGSLQHIITSTAALEELAARLAAAPAIGLDTEFLRERTFRAELCLIQASDAGSAVCVDPLALPDLAPLAHVLGAAQPVKVMHASRQDIEVLLPATCFVRPVFDTQIAAALTGLPAQIGYGELVRRVLGHELAKGHTRTDWTQRPLSPEQIEYALDDVRYLLPLKAKLEEQLHQLGRTAWLEQELTELAEPGAFAVDPERAWLRLKGLRGLDAGRVRLARELAAWRERRAVDRNRPRGWILDDAVLREVVQRVPRSLNALGAIPDMPRAVVERSGEDILALVKAAGIPDPPPPLPPRTRPDPALTALVKKLSQVNQATAQELNLSPEVLATRRDLEQLAEGNREVGVLHGWRREVIGERLLAAL
jgi:ribonuclease D